MSLLNNLPFASKDVEEWSSAELLKNGHITNTYARDGVLGFHSLKICSSNAKILAQYFQFCMGFKEIAYKGLETGNSFTASHVVQNGSILIEITNIIRDLEEDSEMQPNSCFEPQVKDIIDHKIDSFAKRHSIDAPTIKLSILKQFAIKLKTHRENEKEPKYREILAAKKLTREKIDMITFQDYISKHGDGVLDVSFLVVDVVKSFEKAISAGAVMIEEPHTETDKSGSVKIAIIGVPNTDIQHTMIQNLDYKGNYLPGYQDTEVEEEDGEEMKGHNGFNFKYLLENLPSVDLVELDHCVENYTWDGMMKHAIFYANAFGFHKYWSVDESEVFTGNTSLKSIVMASSNGKVKIPINEPGEGKLRGQIEEFYDFHEGPGIQHIALRTHDIISTIKSLVIRGVQFNDMSDAYYENLKNRMNTDGVKIHESLSELKKLNILVDYDPSTRNKHTKYCNYILQIFSKPLSDRPTLFIEIIQRRHHNGFGKGTFKGLFETIEAQQKLRGTLVKSSRNRNI
ncbi:hypothetical protein CAAN1_29S00782 [[Candida] anglica]|uniref:4-hydroxyphenylpyruvate dioxygenase n=1 Tax=[Candida] anglica TaxID=148631 RepID=A0ABP0EEH8_9ASCO